MAGAETTKSGSAWVYQLRKEEVIAQLHERGIPASEANKLDELRRILKEAVRTERETNDGEKEDKTGDGEREEDAETKQNVEDSESGSTTREGREMEYTTQLDFKIGVDNWEQFVERIEFYFEAKGITDANKQRAIFLTKIDAAAYATVRKVCAPAKPKDVTLVEIIRKVGEYVKPKVNVTVLRSRFRERMQAGDETVAQYMASLRDLATECEFTSEEEAIKDQLLTGIRDKDIKIALFRIGALTLQTAIETATAVEEAQKAADKFKVDTETNDNNSNERERAGVDRLQRRGRNRGGQQANRSSRTERYRAGRSPTRDGQQRDSLTSRNNQRQRQQHGSPTPGPSTGPQCFCCGKPGHVRADCWHRGRTCDSCGGRGHLQAVCREQMKREKKPVKNMQRNNESSESETESEWYADVFPVRGNKCNAMRIKPQFLCVKVENRELHMEVDGGADVSLISEREYKKNFAGIRLMTSDTTLNYYGGEETEPVGMIKNIVIEFGKIKTKGNLYVMGKTGKPLLGRDWLHKLGLWPLGIEQSEQKITDVKRIVGQPIEEEEIQGMVKELFNKYAGLFSPGLGNYTKTEFVIRMKDGVVPIYRKPRTLPLALKDKVGAEIDRLIQEGVLSPVEASEWGTPIVPVAKDDGTLRICGDYKVTVNPELLIDRHPLPRIEHLIANLQGGVFFSKIDLKEAYAQVPVSEESKKILTISTHRGSFQPNKLPYGIASAPGFFQRQMEQIFADMPDVNVFLDDIIIKGKTAEENVERTSQVLDKLRECGLKLKKKKCELLVRKIRYLGVEIDEHGVHVLRERVEAIDKAPAPTTKKELQAFLGMINYYAKFIKDRASKWHPLYGMLKNEKFHWTDACQQAFETAKRDLKSAEVLINYDPEKKISLTCDASDYGVSAILAHVTPEGERPIAYASKTLSMSERNYAPIDKEARAIVFGVTKFYDYLYGQKFLLKTDHQPLVRIFGPKKGITIMAARRLQRYASFLSAFEYEIVYVRSENNSADGLSRLPTPATKKELEPKKEFSYLHLVEQESFACFNDRVVARETRKDKVLGEVSRYISKGWPKRKNIPETLWAFEARKDELGIEQDCIMWGYRVVIPEKLKDAVIKELHATHSGVVKMKAIARSFFWWPKIDADIENVARTCHDCVELRDEPPKTELNPWKWPEKPWHRVHTDFIGPYKNYNFLLAIDARTKWPEVFLMKSTTAEATVKVFRNLFSRFGLPFQIVSDNGPQYTSKEFGDFLKKLGVIHTFSAVKHPATNGAAENYVKTFKRKLKILLKTGNPVQEAIDKILFDYRSTKHCTTGESPAKLMLGRELRTRFEMLRPEVGKKVETEQLRQIQNAGGKRVVEFREGEEVWAKDFGKNSATWVKAEIVEKLGPVTYKVKLNSERVVKRHVDQIVKGAKPTVRTFGDEQTEKTNEGEPVRRSARLKEKAIKRVTFRLEDKKIVKPG